MGESFNSVSKKSGGKIMSEEVEKTLEDLNNKIEKIENEIYFLMKGIAIMFMLIIIFLIYIAVLVD